MANIEIIISRGLRKIHYDVYTALLEDYTEKNHIDHTEIPREEFTRAYDKATELLATHIFKGGII